MTNYLTRTNTDFSSGDLSIIMDETKNLALIDSDESFNQKLDQLRKNYPTLISKVFGTPIDRTREKYATNLAKNYFDARIKMMDIHIVAKLDATKIAANNMVLAVGERSKEHLLRVVEDSFAKMSQVVMKSRADMNAKMMTQVEDLEKYRNVPWLYDATLASLKNQLLQYFNTLDVLLQGFAEGMQQKRIYFSSGLGV